MHKVVQCHAAGCCTLVHHGTITARAGKGDVMRDAARVRPGDGPAACDRCRCRIERADRTAAVIFRFGAHLHLGRLRGGNRTRTRGIGGVAGGAAGAATVATATRRDQAANDEFYASHAFFLVVGTHTTLEPALK